MRLGKLAGQVSGSFRWSPTAVRLCNVERARHKNLSEKLLDSRTVLFISQRRKPTKISTGGKSVPAIPPYKNRRSKRVFLKKGASIVVNLERIALNVRKSIWQQHLGPVKTEESEKVMPLDDEMIAVLLRWRSETPYAGDQDWIFASARMKGRQPLWPEAIERNYIRPAAEQAKITKHISWHVFRHYIFYASCRE